jgi:serine/threonine protein kinase
MLGDFEILQELGRGGMGIVHLARQRSLNRLVALKVLIVETLGQTEALQRFRREAESVAKLQHANIVQVFEIGSIQNCSYLALEYLNGGSLLDYLRGVPCSPEEAASLLETIAHAVHFAHQRGIIHRDLKPANILLSGPEAHNGNISARPALSVFAPKVADFGLAKELGLDSDQSRTGLVLGTPSYMAPEQARSEFATIGPVTDVYALGAILYELLTGRPPFRGSNTLETVQQALEVEPVPPSRLRPGTPRDLETICLKCLQKEPSRRYHSAQAVAEDLHRYLTGLPILARKVSFPERWWRWARRNPVRAVLTAALALSVAVGSASVLWQWRRAESEKTKTAKERDEANRLQALAQQEKATAQIERDRAEEHLKLANGTIRGFVELVDYLDNSQMFYISYLDIRPEVLKAQVAHTQQIVLQNTGRPDRLVELADAYARLALLKRKLNQFSDGIADAQKALAIRQELARERPGVMEFERDLAACHQTIGFLYHARGGGTTPEDSRAGLPDLEAALTIRTTIFEREPTNLEYANELANCYNHLGLTYCGMREYAKAVECYELAIRRQNVAYSAAPQIARYRLSLSNHFFNLANACIQLSRVDDAVEAGRHCRDLGPNEPEALVRYARVLAMASGWLGKKVHATRDDLTLRERFAAEAVQLLRQAFDLGYDNLALIVWPHVSEPLQDRKDFQELIRSVKEKCAGESPAKN